LSGISVEHVPLPGSAFEFRLSANRHYLAFHDIQLADGEIAVGSELRSQSRSIPDSLTFVPAGLEAAGWSEPSLRSNSFTAIYFDDLSIREEVRESFTLSNPKPFLYKRNKALETTLAKLRSAVTSGSGAAYVESLIMVAICELLEVRDSKAPNALSERQLNLVIEYVEARLGQDISVEEIAKVLGLSRFHFSRQFKASTSQSPYQFLLGRRIQRSAEFLSGTDMPLGEIAAACGFNSIAQFSEAFARVHGIRPHAYRRGRK